MLLQQSPFRGEDEDEIYDAILADEPLYPIHMPRDSVSILQKLLTREPEMRLGSGPTDAQEVMSHSFFRNINWDDIYHKRVPPPFLPQISNATDTSNFDQEFTSVTPVLTPVQSGRIPLSSKQTGHLLTDVQCSPYASYAGRIPWLLLHCRFCLIEKAFLVGVFARRANFFYLFYRCFTLSGRYWVSSKISFLFHCCFSVLLAHGSFLRFLCVRPDMAWPPARTSLIRTCFNFSEPLDVVYLPLFVRLKRD